MAMSVWEFLGWVGVGCVALLLVALAVSIAIILVKGALGAEVVQSPQPMVLRMSPAEDPDAEQTIAELRQRLTRDPGGVL